MNNTPLQCPSEDFLRCFGFLRPQSVQDELIVDLSEQVRAAQRRVEQFVGSTDDETALAAALTFNDELARVLAKHDAIATGQPLPEEELPRSAAPVAPQQARSYADEEDEDDFARLAHRCVCDYLFSSCGFVGTVCRWEMLVRGWRTCQVLTTLLDLSNTCPEGVPRSSVFLFLPHLIAASIMRSTAYKDNTEWLARSHYPSAFAGGHPAVYVDLTSTSLSYPRSSRRSSNTEAPKPSSSRPAPPPAAPRPISRPPGDREKVFDLLSGEYVDAVGSPSNAQATAATVSVGSPATGKSLRGAYIILLRPVNCPSFGV